MSTIEEDLRFLITELQEERTNTGDELATCPIPGTFGEAWDLFRALCNTRLPEHVSGKFLAKQDKLLHAIIDEEGITYAGLIPPCESDPRFAVWRGDITTLAADAIVNAANAQLAGGSGVCGAIFTEAGWDDMQRACDRIGGCPTGHAVVTPGFRLKAKYVIHTVGPIYSGATKDAELLRSAYRSCLERAEELGLHSIGFCSISTGIYGYPLNEAVKIAADTLRTFPAKSLTDIRVYCYGEREYQAFTKELG